MQVKRHTQKTIKYEKYKNMYIYYLNKSIQILITISCLFEQLEKKTVLRKKDL